EPYLLLRTLGLAGRVHPGGAAHRGPINAKQPLSVVTGAASQVSALGGQGRGRTADLPLFRRTLVPTELPGRWIRHRADSLGDPDGTRTRDLRRDRAAR